MHHVPIDTPMGAMSLKLGFEPLDIDNILLKIRNVALPKVIRFLPFLSSIQKNADIPFGRVYATAIGHKILDAVNANQATDNAQMHTFELPVKDDAIKFDVDVQPKDAEHIVIIFENVTLPKQFAAIGRFADLEAGYETKVTRAEARTWAEGLLKEAAA